MSARPDYRREATEARLGALDLPASGAWLRAARVAARDRLAAMGMAQRRDEYWRFTDPADLNATAVEAVEEAASEEEQPFDGIDALRVVLVDGVVDAAASDDLALAGVEVARLSEAGALDLHWAQGLYGQLEAEGQSPVARPFAALNTAAATEGLLIRVTGVAPRPILIDQRRGAADADVVLHHVVRLEPGASLTLLERGAAAARLSTVLEVEVGDGASFHHVRTQGRDHGRRAATHLFARLGEGARLRAFTLAFNGRLTRNEAVVRLEGRGGVAHIAGAAVGDGAFHHDDTIFVTHAAENCESRQVVKKVLRAGAVGVFQGKILVKPGAQKTDGYQLAQALLLDERSQFLAKPELEIYADDVACSHGATAGALDETALFYLRSRGVPEREAKDLLTLAFLREALSEIEDEAIADSLSRRLAAWLGRRG